MKKATLLLCAIITLTSNGYSQFKRQYFDGADTNINYSLEILIDTNQSNIWQIGVPQKNIFNAASTFPNALLTDTINHYPSNNHSSFKFSAQSLNGGFGILALQWNQKIDLEQGKDFGSIEFSTDTGKTWQDVYSSPYTYNFYGFNLNNLDTMSAGSYGFTGTDTNWRNIWLCFDISWLFTLDTIEFKFTLHSDSINNQEGWMIDNLLLQRTIIHTINEKEETGYTRIGPNPSSDKIYIETKKITDFHIIESLRLMNTSGQVLDHWENCPTKFHISVDKYPPGNYLLEIRTNLKTEVHQIIIN